MASGSDDTADKTQQELTVMVTAMGGDKSWTLSMPPGSCVADLVQAVSTAGGPPALSQRLLFGSQMLGRSHELQDLAGDAADDTSPLQIALVQVKELNVALASAGAQLLGGLGDQQGNMEKPLMQHDIAFPIEKWGEGLEGVPSGQQNGEVLERVLREAGWDGDCQQSTFLHDDGQVQVKLAGDGAHLTRIGFTYSPWDRNRGRECVIEVSSDGESYMQVGTMHCPYVTERGDPSQHDVINESVEVPPELGADRQRFVRWSWAGGAGRRVYFVHARGYP